MSFPFNTTTLPEPTEEKIKVLMAATMQNGLMIVMIRLGQAFWHQETAAVIDGQLWELE